MVTCSGRSLWWVVCCGILRFDVAIGSGGDDREIEKRVNDGSVLRLIQKWIKGGAIDNGKLLVSETGTGQGQPISPLLANVYLYHVLECVVRCSRRW
jgi:hypothetical protein